MKRLWPRTAATGFRGIALTLAGAISVGAGLLLVAQGWDWLDAGTGILAVTGLGMGAVAILYHLALVRFRAAEAGKDRSRESLEAAYDLLAAADAKSRALLEAASTGLALVNGDGFIIEANRRWEAIFGEEPGGSLGKLLRDQFPAHEAAYLQARLRKVGLGEPLLPAQWEVRLANGTIRIVESHPSPVKVLGEAMTLIALNDVTEQTHLRQRAALNDRLTQVGTLAAGIVHEINNPTAAALGSLELMAELLKETPRPSDPPQAFRDKLARLNDRSMQATRRIQEIVATIKGFARMDAGEMGPLSLGKVLEATMAMIRHELRAKGKVELEIPGDLPRIWGNAGRLQQLLVNLLVNAAQAMEPGKAGNRIEIRARVQGEFLVLEIQDTGRGIPAEHLPRVLQPFFTTKPAGIGSGLGLSISQEIARQHGGDLELESRAGEGTLVRVTLAINRPPQMADVVPEMTGKVLLVGEDAAWISGLEAGLSHAFECLRAETCRAALALLDAHPIQWIVTEVRMADLSGIDLHRQVLAQRPDLARRMVFVLDGAADGATAGYLHGQGLPVLQRPFPLKRLQDALLAPG